MACANSPVPIRQSCWRWVPGTSCRPLPDSRAGRTGEIVSSLPHPQSNVPDTDHLLASLGRLWSAGVPVNWAAFHEHERLRRVSLPTCPFERQRYFIEPKARVVERPNITPSRPQAKDWFYVPILESDADARKSAAQSQRRRRQLAGIHGPGPSALPFSKCWLAGASPP